MAVFKDLNNLPKFHNAVLTIGSFDGVHCGHKVILNKVVEEAKKLDGESILITFYPHPRKVLHPETKLSLLTDLDEKIRLITALGINHIVVVPFTKEFSQLSATDYIEDFLWANFHPKTIIIGYDHRFGHAREGDINLLRETLSSRVQIKEIPAQLIKDAIVSSTKIRESLKEGAIQQANQMLERSFTLSGKVVYGEKLGRKLGFPTANLSPISEDILIPGNGVYIVNTIVDGQKHPSMLGLGVRPTINSKNIRSIESNILDFHQDIYGQFIVLEFLKFLRPELKFDSEKELVQQMKKDEEDTRRFFEA